ncbi:MAG TPA: DapH/DapD/GlmU-related protein [Prolixibacteraceae bacterium]|nr:DapH/DapD/GlmU-related protein [Prolixibacteraceae bacterium]
MKTIVFLGCGHNALSMFVEIALKQFSRDVRLTVVQNLDIVSDIPYLPEGITASVVRYDACVFSPESNYCIGVNLPGAKKTVFEFFREKAGIGFDNYARLIDPFSSLACSVKLGKGVVINPGVVLAPFVELRNLVTLNRNVSIGHHTMLGNFTTVHPGANIAGHCRIGEGVTIGMGANITDSVSVGDGSVIGAGSLVTKDVPARVVVYGSPARIIRPNS